MRTHSASVQQPPPVNPRPNRLWRRRVRRYPGPVGWARRCSSRCYLCRRSGQQQPSGSEPCPHPFPKPGVMAPVGHDDIRPARQGKLSGARGAEAGSLPWGEPGRGWLCSPASAPPGGSQSDSETCRARVGVDGTEVLYALWVCESRHRCLLCPLRPAAGPGPRPLPPQSSASAWPRRYARRRAPRPSCGCALRAAVEPGRGHARQRRCHAAAGA